MENKNRRSKFGYAKRHSYFVNTGWLDRVTNDSDNTRIVLIFGVDYDNTVIIDMSFVAQND